MNRFALLAISLLFSLYADAQHLPIFTQYRDNIGIINPAAVSGDYFAFDHNMSFGGSYRLQWVGLETAPKTQTIRGSYLIDDRGGIGMIVGGHLINDQTGPTGFTGAYGRFAGIISDDPYFGGLSFGLSLGLVQYRVNVSQLRLREQNDVLTMDDQSKLFPDAGLGVYYYRQLESGFLSGDYVYGGISIPQVVGLNLKFKDDSGEFYTQRIQHVYGLLGMQKFFDNDNFLEPSVWIRYAPNAPVNADFSLKYQMEGNLWVGLGMATSGIFHVDAGLIVGENLGFANNLKIGYNFDYSFNTYGPFVGTTHEFNVTYSLQR